MKMSEMSERQLLLVKVATVAVVGVAVFLAMTHGPGARPRPESIPIAQQGRGWLKEIDGYLVLHVEGTPEEMGEQHGRLLKERIQKACRALITDEYVARARTRLIEATKVMERHLPDEFRREMKALAKAAEIDYWDCVAMQLFGDTERAQLPAPTRTREPAAAVGGMQCTSYAVFGAATKTGELIVGRNFDYLDHGVGKYGAILMHAKPDKGYAFVTITWAGIINGWTLMNEKGLVTCNNTEYRGENSMEGISTCFMLRKAAQFAGTVKEGIEIVRKGPRACGTLMLIAGGEPADAAVVEYDCRDMAVRTAPTGYVMAANTYRALHRATATPAQDADDSRYGVLLQLIRENYGKIDRTMNFAGAEGVPLGSINLHSALLFPKDLIIRVSMGKTPAYKERYRGFRMTRDGVTAEGDAARQ